MTADLAWPDITFNETAPPPSVLTCPSCGENAVALLGRHFLALYSDQGIITAECRDGSPVMVGHPGEFRNAACIAVLDGFWLREMTAARATGFRLAPGTDPEYFMTWALDGTWRETAGKGDGRAPLAP